MRQWKQIIVLAILITAVAASAAQAQTTLRYRPKKGDKLHYLLQQEMVTTLSAKGKESVTTTNVIWDISWTVRETDGKGGAQLQLKIERVRTTTDGPAGKAAADSEDKNEPEGALRKGLAATVKFLAAMDLSGTLLPTGEFKDLKVSKETMQTLKTLGATAKEEEILNSDIAKMLLFTSAFPFPADAVAKGKTWSNKTEAKAGFGKALMSNTFTYDGPADKDGATLEKVSIKPVMKLEVDAKSPLKVELKDFKAGGHALFDNKAGRMIYTVINQRTEMQMEAKGMTFTQTIEQSVSIQLKAK